MSRASVRALSASIAAGVAARAKSLAEATAVVSSLVRRLRMHPINVLNGSRDSTAIELTIGAFHFGASRRRIFITPLIVVGVSGRDLVRDFVSGLDWVATRATNFI